MIHICRYCREDIVGKEDFETHERSHRNSFSCKLCMKIFSTQGNARKHEKFHIAQGHEMKSKNLK